MKPIMIFISTVFVLHWGAFDVHTGAYEFPSNTSLYSEHFIDDHTKVTATIYTATLAECDSTPDITADGTKIRNPATAGRLRYVAMSRNLLQYWGGEFAFGDTIHVENAGKYSGHWVVRDTMASRWKNKIDFLVDVGTKPNKFKNVKIRKKV